MSVQSVLRRVRLAVALAALGALGACASFGMVGVRVSTPHPAPAALRGAEVQLQADPANAAAPDAATLQHAIVGAMTRAGLRPLIGMAAPYTLRYSYAAYLDFEASFPSGWPPPGPPIVLPDGSVIYSGVPFWWSGWSWPPPWYDRVLRVELRRVADGRLLWSSGAVLGSYDARLAPVAAVLADAVFAGFPQASGTRELRVHLP